MWRVQGRVTPILYSRLVTSLRSASRILPCNPTYTLTQIHVCNSDPTITIKALTQPDAYVPALTLRRSCNALPGELVLPSASTLSNICRREYTLTVDAIKRQLPARNKDSLDFGRMEIDEQIGNTVGHGLLFGSNLGVAWSTTGIWWGW